MKNLKVLLGDPRHITVGAHSYFVPIGIGYIGSNLLKHFKKNNIELFYLNGPIYKKFFLENQSKINNKIFYEKFTNITIIKDLVLLDKDKVGDFPTHVNKSFKDLITNEYIDILKLNELL